MPDAASPGIAGRDGAVDESGSEAALRGTVKAGLVFTLLLVAAAQHATRRSSPLAAPASATPDARRLKTSYLVVRPACFPLPGLGALLREWHPSRIPWGLPSCRAFELLLRKWSCLRILGNVKSIRLSRIIYPK